MTSPNVKGWRPTTVQPRTSRILPRTKGPRVRFYAASSFNARDSVRVLAKKIEKELGWKCTARWLNDDEEIGQNAQTAIMDRDDISCADVMVVFSEESTTGGKWFECGLAYGLDIPIYMIKHEPEQVCLFQLLPGIKHFDSIEDFISHKKQEE